MTETSMHTSTNPAPSDDPMTWFAQALAYMRLKHWDEAEEALREALQLAPDYAEAHCNLAYVLEQRGELQAAEAAYRLSFDLAPSLINAALNLGVLLQSLNRFDESEAIYRAAIQHHPQQAAPWTNLGILYTAMQREHEAELSHRQALALEPGYRKAQFNLSYLLLRQGRFEEGWACLDARTLLTHAALINAPRWKGETLSGKRLLLICEGGHGDCIQFYRYALLLQQQWSVRLQVLCPPGLAQLFSMQNVFEHVWTEVGPVECDFWCTTMSLPGLLGTRIDNIPADTPYLSVAPEYVHAWQAMLPASGLKVGLAWKGNARYENDADRSLPSLQPLAALGKLANVHFIRLQQELPSEQDAASLNLHALPQTPSNFAEVAALMSGLDLVISVDTAAAHLAGALGKPCWLMLPHYMADWRWLTERDDSPWYPGMRLFRQEIRGDWAPVASAIEEALQRMLVA